MHMEFSAIFQPKSSAMNETKATYVYIKINYYPLIIFLPFIFAVGLEADIMLRFHEQLSLNWASQLWKSHYRQKDKNKL